MWYQHKERHVEKWNRIENSEEKKYSKIYNQSIFDKLAKITRWGKSFNK